MSEFQQPAFPTVDANREEDYGTRGMTLRDYFAAKAMQGLVSGFNSNDLNHNWSAKDFANEAYEYADAMMKAREKKD